MVSEDLNGRKVVTGIGTYEGTFLSQFIPGMNCSRPTLTSIFEDIRYVVEWWGP